MNINTAHVLPGSVAGDAIAGAPPGSEVQGRQYATDIPAQGVAAREAFLRELPKLLQTHAGWSAAYRNGTRIGIDASARDLFWRLVRAGEDPAAFYVFTVEPQQAIEIEILHSP